MKNGKLKKEKEFLDEFGCQAHRIVLMKIKAKSGRNEWQLQD